MEKTFERRLCRAVELGFQKMETARKARYKFLAQYVGPFYSKNKGAAGSDERKASPLNLMYNAVTTMVPNLVYNDPRVKIRTEVLAYRNYAGTLELATNHLVRKIKLRHTLRKVITATRNDWSAIETFCGTWVEVVISSYASAAAWSQRQVS